MPIRSPIPRILSLVILLPLAGCRVEADTPPEPTLQDPSDEISETLHASAGSWNAGDLDGFMDDYSVDPPATFVGSTGLLHGPDEIRARYLESYWAPGAERDSLRFEDLDVRPFGADHALAVGRYVLYRKTDSAGADSTVATGWFSLWWERQAEGWKILHDHSS